MDLLPSCTVRHLARPADQLSTILATHDDNFDVLAACCTINVALAEAMLRLQTAATVRSHKRVSVTKTKLLNISKYGADRYQKINKIANCIVQKRL